MGGDTRSRGTNYPQNQFFGVDCCLVHEHGLFCKHSNSTSPFQSSITDNNSSCRRFDTRNRARNNLFLGNNLNHSNHRLPKLHQQKRRSIGSSNGPTENTMSTSVSMNSGISNRWSNLSFTNHSHSALIEVNELKETNNNNNNNNDSEMLSTNSWASSGHPLLNSDHDSSMSQLMLSNLGYTSSDSRNSMNNHLNGQIQPTSFCSNQEITSNLTTESNELIQNEVDTQAQRPVQTSYDLAAGYIWPQWPNEVPIPNHPIASTIEETNCQNLDYSQINTIPSIQSENETNFPFLNRQLWLRRNARQRNYYMRQMQQHRSAVYGNDGQLMGNSSNDLLLINQNDVLNAIQEDSDTDQEYINRYCLDPTNPV